MIILHIEPDLLVSQICELRNPNMPLAKTVLGGGPLNNGTNFLETSKIVIQSQRLNSNSKGGSKKMSILSDAFFMA